MPFKHPVCFGLSVAGLAVLGLTAVRPASAQDLTYTLSGLTFNDGATATGSFSFDSSTQNFSAFDITTSNSQTDTLVGTRYTPASDMAVSPNNQIWEFFDQIHPEHLLLLATSLPVTGPGTYAISPGELQANGFGNSGEVLPFAGQGQFDNEGDRVILNGNLVVTPAAVPEASTTVSFGMLLVLGVGGTVIAARKKKSAA